MLTYENNRVWNPPDRLAACPRKAEDYPGCRQPRWKSIALQMGMAVNSIKIRPAQITDAEEIVDVMQSSFEPRILRLTIYKCSGIAEYVRHQVTIGHSCCDTRHIVALVDDRIAGCIELRSAPGEVVFLNYIGVRARYRGNGIGKKLLQAAVSSLARSDCHEFRLDVLEDNHVATSWYERLGLEYGDTTEWWSVPINYRHNSPEALLVGYPQAEVCQKAFGFSQFTVFTTNGRHVVGRLGEDWFRLTDSVSLADSGLIAALARLDPNRHLLALIPEHRIQTVTRERAHLLVRLRQMSVGLETVMKNLIY